MTRPRAEVLHTALGRLHAGAFAEVIALLAPLRRANGEDVEAALLHGLACAGDGNPTEAARVLGQVAQLRPKAPHPAVDVIALLSKSAVPAAIDAYFNAGLALAPQDARLLLVAGGWLQRNSRGEQARPLLERAVALQPSLSAAQISLAAVEAESGELDEAIARLRGTLERDPGNAAALGNLGAALGVQARFDEALGCFEQARRLAPRQVQIAINHGIARLKCGQLAQGWADLNLRLGLPGHALLPPHKLLPVLAPGVRLDGRTVLVTHDSGYGDTLQFARYLPMLRARGARVLLWVPQPLNRLMAETAEVFSDNRAWPLHDFHCPIIRLAEVFATTLETIPAEVPYLRVDPALMASWAQRLPEAAGKRVGLVWAGSSRESNLELLSVDRRRSIDPALLSPLLAVPGVTWVSLQLGRPHPGFEIFDPMPDVTDFADTAAIIASLDAVVSVDTSVAHLAGALGKPVLLLDRADHCWRWLAERTDSPWYPTLLIFRQRQWGDWSTPIREIAETLSPA
jgi:tetratricopeptide (TPR) repeat protein